MSYDARHDADIHTTLPQGSHIAVSRLPPQLLAKVGERVATGTSALQRTLAAIGPLPAASQAAFAAALGELAHLERLGVQVQEVARVLSADGSSLTERFDLGAALRQAAEGWAPDAQQRGIDLRLRADPVEVTLNAPVVEQLLDLAVEHALHLGSRVEVRSGMEGQPPRAMVTLDILRDPKTPVAAEEFDDLHWLLVAALARAHGFSPRRMVVADHVILMIGFTEPEAHEDHALHRSDALLPRTPVARGHGVLLVDPQDVSREHAARLLRDAGILVDIAASPESAAAMLEGPLVHRVPDLLLTGHPVGEGRCDGLIDALRALQPRLRVVELVDDDSAFALSVPGSDLPAKVGRPSMERTLVAAVSQELDAAWADRG